MRNWSITRVDITHIREKYYPQLCTLLLELAFINNQKLLSFVSVMKHIGAKLTYVCYVC